MKKFSIAFDADGVLNNLIEKTVEKYNKIYNKNLLINDIKEYDIHKVLPFEEAEKFCDLFLDKTIWDSLEPTKNSQWALKKLIDDGFDVYVATATHYINFPWKVKWFEEYFPFISYKNIICINNKGLLDVDILVDDCVDNLLSSTWSHRVLYNQPWNQNVHDECYLIHRVNNFNELIEVVNKIYDDEQE